MWDATAGRRAAARSRAPARAEALRLSPASADEVGVLDRSRLPITITVVLALIGLTPYAARGLRPDRVTRVYDDAGCGHVRQKPGADGAGATDRWKILCLLNYERGRHGLAPLVENRALDAASEAHSADMERRRYFEHVSPDGVPPEQRMMRLGYVARPGGMTGENIAWGEDEAGSAASIVDGWMHSPHHRENILRPQFREVGIGLALGHAPGTMTTHGTSATYTTDFGG